MTDKFYYLKAGDEVREGDEFLSYCCGWLPTGGPGYILIPKLVGRYRRAIPAAAPCPECSMIGEAACSEHSCEPSELTALRAEVERLKQREEELKHALAKCLTPVVALLITHRQKPYAELGHDLLEKLYAANEIGRIAFQGAPAK